jgi:hypothetical protein
MSSLPETDIAKLNLTQALSEYLNLPCTGRNYAIVEFGDMLSLFSYMLVCNLQKVRQASLEYKESMIIQKKSPYLGIFKHT